MTKEERLDLLKQIEKDIHVCSLESTFLDDAKSCAIHSAIEELEQEPKWIPVSERLPEDGTWNLFTDGKNISVERYKSDAIDHFYPNGRWFSLEEVIAWMPLPKPYEPQESVV